MGEPKLPSAFLQVCYITPSVPVFRFLYDVLLVVDFHTPPPSSSLMLCFTCFILQVICWVLGEYGTASGKYSASYITGKLCDVAEAHSADDTVKVGI